MGTKFIIVRHGETAWNRGRIFRGTYDIPLNENGKKQACLAGKSLKNVKINAVYTSPLSRAKESAEIAAENHGITPIVHNGFLDMDYGEWTGKEEAEVAKLWPDECAVWACAPHTVRPYGGTTLKEIFDNAFSAMEELALKHDGETIAIFSHRVVNKLLLLGALSLGLDRFPFIIQGNCCINEIERVQNGYLIERLNDTSHIRNAGIDLLKADF